MANRTAWTAGNGAGLTWTSGFGAADLTSLPSGDVVLSSGAAIANGANLDMFADASVEITIASSTPSAGAYIALWIAPLQEDGTTYGDGQLTAGVQAAYTPPWAPAAIIPIESGTALTKMMGSVSAILLPPRNFLWILGNFTGLTFSGTAGNNVMKFITENVNLNN
ncbi:MAG TPA: hypothetical protein VFA12_20225 [Stellaceae bacterium]|nr:hypothetical protein [Stellaceae bacterium]